MIFSKNSRAGICSAHKLGEDLAVTDEEHAAAVARGCRLVVGDHEDRGLLDWLMDSRLSSRSFAFLESRAPVGSSASTSCGRGDKRTGAGTRWR
jgi:hypothetical protein